MKWTPSIDTKQCRNYFEIQFSFQLTRRISMGYSMFTSFAGSRGEEEGRAGLEFWFWFLIQSLYRMNKKSSYKLSYSYKRNTIQALFRVIQEFSYGNWNKASMHILRQKSCCLILSWPLIALVALIQIRLILFFQENKMLYKLFVRYKATTGKAEKL